MSRGILLSISIILFFVGCGSKKEKSLGYSLEQRLGIDKNMQKTEKIIAMMTKVRWLLIIRATS